MNLSERLAKAAMERRGQPEASAQRVHVTSIESQPKSGRVPARTQAPVDAGRVAVMKMRLPEPTNPDTTTQSSAGLPLWQRPFVDVMRDAGLATVTSLPIRPRAEEAIGDDLDDFEMARTIPMPAVRMTKPVIDIDRDEGHLPRLATSESEGLAGGTLRSDDDHHHPPRVTFGPIDLVDDITPRAAAAVALSRVDGEHLCPQCGAEARIDIHDPIRGRIHLSCVCCFKMWQERVEPTVHSDEPFMRD